jgi:DNA repair exonuclease SbcCD ATPase subunit
MKKVIFFLIIAILSVFNHHGAFAADKDKLLYEMNKVKSAIDRLSTETAEFSEDILAARNYLKIADTEISKNTTLLGKVKDEAEPTIMHYISMADLTASVVQSKIEKTKHDAERMRLEKLIPEVKAKIKIFADKNAEIERLKAELAKSKSDSGKPTPELQAKLSQKQGEIDALSKEIVSLKSENANLSSQINALKSENQGLKSDSQKTRDELNVLKGQKGAELSELQLKATALARFKEVAEEAGKIGMISAVSNGEITVIIPRAKFIRTTPKGIAPSQDSDEIIARISALMNRFREYKAIIKVHGFGQPTKNEDGKATANMSKIIKDLLTEKGKINAEMITASGAGMFAPLFSRSDVEANRRVEITFVSAGPAK